MTKKEVQSRVLYNGKPLPLEDFTWDEKTRVFSSSVNRLMLDFKYINNVTFNTGSSCIFDTGSDCKFDTGSSCIFDTDSRCTFDTGSRCIFNTSSDCKFKTDDSCTFDTGSNRCTFKTGSSCIFNTGSDCKFKTGSRCTFKTGNDCTFNTDSSCIFNVSWHCIFDTGSDCKFKTGSSCTFDTGSRCIFNTDYDCTFKTDYMCTFRTNNNCIFSIGEQCVIIRRDRYEVIFDKREIQLCPDDIEGYLEKIDDAWYLNGDMPLGEHIIADKILSKVVSKKKINNGTVYRVYNYINKGISETPFYLIELDGTYSHGNSIRDARDSLMYKMVDRDTSAYTDMTLDTVYTIPEAIKMYRTITGACSEGVKMFIESIDNISNTISVKDILNITKDQYGYKELKEFIDKTK